LRACARGAIRASFSLLFPPRTACAGLFFLFRQSNASVERFCFYTSLLFGCSPPSLSSPLAAASKLLPNDTVTYLINLADLARTANLVTAGEGVGSIIGVTSAIGMVNILKAYFDAGINPEWIELAVWDSNGYRRTVRVLCFRGIPIFVDDFVPTDVRLGTFTNGTMLYFLRVGRGGLYAVTSAGAGGEGGGTAGRGAPVGSEVRVAEHESESSTRYRLSLPVALVLERQCAAASLTFRPSPGTT
jgi:hypothetical protein